MQIQIVSRYIALSEEGLVPKLECPMDQGSLFCNMGHEDDVYLYCLSCDYKKYLGTEAFGNIKVLVENAIRR